MIVTRQGCAAESVFLYHVRRAGGTSLRDYCMRLAAKNGLRFEALEGRSLDHESDVAHAPTALRVICLRDPIERIKSSYRFEGRWPQREPVRTLENAIPFSRWVDRTRCNDGEFSHLWMCTENYYVKSLIGYPLVGAAGVWRAELELARRRLEAFDLVLITEWLDEPDTATYLRQRLQFDMPMPHRRFPELESPQGTDAELFDPATIALLRERNQLDRELYEHARNLCRQRMTATVGGTATSGARRWTAPDIRRFPRTRASARRLLAIVTAREKRAVNSLSDVPPKLVSVTDLRTRMERPKTLNRADAQRAWHGQLTHAFLLQLQDAFIGDNVVFDRDRYYSFGKWWLGNRPDSWTLYRQTREVRHIDKGISITSWGGEAFQLFILDTLPRLGVLLSLLERPDLADLKLVSHHDGARAAQWFWRKLGLSDRIVQKPKDAQEGFVIHADLVLYPNWAPNLGYYGLHPRGSLLPVQQRLGVLDGTQQDLVLYVDRASRFRSVANRDALLDRVRRVLSGSGYTLRTFGSSGDLQRDMELVKRAKMLFGPHGGGLANMVFAQPGTHVIEFQPLYRLYRKGTHRPVYWGLSQAAGLDYWSVEPTNFHFDQPGMEVDVDQVATIVGNLIGDAKRARPRTAVARVRKPSGRERVLLFGSPGYRLPKLFDWTHREGDATMDTAVMFNQHIVQQLKRPGKKIGWIRESPAIAVWMRVTPLLLKNLDRVAEAYEVILTCDRSLCALHPKIQFHPAGANLPWPWIQEKDYRIYPKSKLCSMFASPKTMVEGHLIRHCYAERLKDQLDLYGGACGSPRIGEGIPPDKSAGIVPYMFSVTMENCQTDFYYTEKITDCFAAGTIPVYWGSDAIGEVFDTDGIIPLDESFSVDSLSKDRYRGMLPAARNNLQVLRDLELADDTLYRRFIAHSSPQPREQRPRRKGGSQIGQDRFVLETLGHRRGGTFLDIGCAYPDYLSNTFLLELEYGWRGVAIDIRDLRSVDGDLSWSELRPSTVHRVEDALRLDWRSVLTQAKMPAIIDYLSLDLDPPAMALECLRRLPLDDYRFRVITFETDEYRGPAGVERARLSRRLLSDRGYTLVQTLRADRPQDDCWVHPDLLPHR